MKTLLLGLALTSLSAFASEDCIRDATQYSKDGREDAIILDRLVGRYELSGDPECNELKVTAHEDCEMESHKWYATEFEVSGKGFHFRYGVGPAGTKGNSRETMIPFRRRIYLENVESSGGGFGGTTYKMNLFVDRDGQLTSISYKEKTGIFGGPDLKFSCDARRVD